VIPSKRPYRAIAGGPQINLHIEATHGIRPSRQQGVTETTNGTIRKESRLRISTANVHEHFCVIQSASNKVQIHGGRWGRTSHGVETIVTPTVDSGTAAEYSGVREVTVTATTGYAIGTINDAYVPSTLTLSYTTNAPGAVADPLGLVMYFAKITAAAGTFDVTNIEPMHMGDIHDRIIVPDTKSLDYDATSHKEEIKGYTTTDATTPFDKTDEFILRPTPAGIPPVRGNVFYRTLAALAAWLGKDDNFLDNVSLGKNAGDKAEIKGFATSGGSIFVADDLFIVKPKIGDVQFRTLSDLPNIVPVSPHPHKTHTNFDDDSHNVSADVSHLLIKAGYVLVDGSAIRNAMSGVIATAAGSQCIDPTARHLDNSAGNVSVDWEEQKLNGQDGVAFKESIDWRFRVLFDSAGTRIAQWFQAGLFEVKDTASQFLISVVTDSDPTDLTKGAFVCKGGGAFKKSLQVGIDLTVGADTAGGNANVVKGNVNLTEGNVNLTKGNVDVQTGGNCYKHNGNSGVTIEGMVSGGIVTGAGLVKKIVQIPDAAGNLYDYEILARPI
jgi:hypothetical protein